MVVAVAEEVRSSIQLVPETLLQEAVTQVQQVDLDPILRVLEVPVVPEGQDGRAEAVEVRLAAEVPVMQVLERMLEILELRVALVPMDPMEMEAVLAGLVKQAAMVIQELQVIS